MDAMQTIIALIFAPTSIVAVVAWLLTKYFEKTLSRDLEGYKAKLNSELEQAKIKLEHDLGMKSFEHQTRFSFFYQKQAEVIEELYGLLINTVINMESLTRPIQFAGEKSQTDKLKDAGEAHNELAKYFHIHRIYIDENVCERIDDVLKIMQLAFHKYMIGSSPGNSSPNRLDFWVEAIEALQQEVPPIKKELEHQFRQILSTGLSATPPLLPPSDASDD